MLRAITQTMRSNKVATSRWVCAGCFSADVTVSRVRGRRVGVCNACGEPWTAGSARNTAFPDVNRLFGGRWLAWTWRVGAISARLRIAWIQGVAAAGMVLLIAVTAYARVRPEAVGWETAERLMVIAGLSPFGYILLVFLSAPVAARWRWAEQRLVLDWAKRHGATVVRRVSYADFASMEAMPWVGTSEPNAPILSHGCAAGYPTVVRTADGVTVARAVLRIMPAIARFGRSKGSRDVMLIATIPVDRSVSIGVNSLCCWSRSSATRIEARMVDRLREQSFESIEMDGRFVIATGAHDDPIAVRQLLDPTALDHFRGRSTVWEITADCVTVYRRTRTSTDEQVDEIVEDARLLASKVQHLQGAVRRQVRSA